MIEVIDCRAIADEWLDDIKNKIQRKGLSPRLTIVSLGEPDRASQVYIRNKIKACDRVGITTKHIIFGSSQKRSDIIQQITNLADSRNTDAIIIQSPSNLDNLSIDEMRFYLPSETDVDCMSFENIGKLRANEYTFYPATVEGIVHLLKKTDTPIAGKRAVVIGRSEIVGRPMADVLTNLDATVTLCHSKTPRFALEDSILSADIVISAVGQRNFIQPNMVNSRAFVVDVGINHDEFGGICGDCASIERWNDFWFWKNDIRITPVPNGVGRLTVAGLMRNVVKAAELKL